MDTLTRYQIDNYPAGPELNKLVAQIVEPEPPAYQDDAKAFDAQFHGDLVMSPGGMWRCICDYWDGDDKPYWEPVNVSSDDAAALKAADILQDRGWFLSLYSRVSADFVTVSIKLKYWKADLWVVGSYRAIGIAETRPLAICRAILEMENYYVNS